MHLNPESVGNDIFTLSSCLAPVSKEFRVPVIVFGCFPCCPIFIGDIEMREITAIRNRAIHMEEGDYFDPQHEAAYLRKIANKLEETQAKLDALRALHATVKRSIKQEVKLHIIRSLKEYK